MPGRSADLSRPSRNSKSRMHAFPCMATVQFSIPPMVVPHPYQNHVPLQPKGSPTARMGSGPSTVPTTLRISVPTAHPATCCCSMHATLSAKQNKNKHRSFCRSNHGLPMQIRLTRQDMQATGQYMHVLNSSPYLPCHLVMRIPSWAPTQAPAP